MKNKFKNKNVLVIGLKKSGVSSVCLLNKLHAFCYVYDDNNNLLTTVYNSIKCNLVNKIDDDVMQIMDYVIISPGVSIYSEYVKLAQLYGVKVIGELELGSYFLKGRLISITGTNGKTTTCSMLYDVLKKSHQPAVLCGNIGEPLTENILPFKSNYVVETSSFQLESATKYKPDIAVITNLSPNHLDRHYTFKNYQQAKYNVYKKMSKRGMLILNYDDKNLQQLNNVKLKPKIVFVSINKEIDGYFAKDNIVYFKKRKKTTKIANLSQIKLVGKHNLLNALFVIAICKKLKLKNSDIQNAIINFEPLQHRLQLVNTVDGVNYINDSKSTSPDSTITAIASYKKTPLILILGGSDKNTNFDNLSKKIKKSKNIKLVVVQGATTKKIVRSLKKYKLKNYVVAEDFNSALSVATKNAQSGDTILLSPACASFDYFNSYEQRGEYFINYVSNLTNN